MAWIGLIVRPDLAYPERIAPLIVAGCGVSMAMPAAQNAVISSVAGNEIGKASGTFNMLRQLGAAFGVAILAAVFAGAGGFSSAQAFSNGFAPAIGVSATLSLLGAMAGMVVHDRKDEPLHQSQLLRKALTSSLSLNSSAQGSRNPAS